MFGLSLGSYEATITIYKNGRTDVLANEGGERSTPMMVTYNKNNTLVGTPSKQAFYRNYNFTAVSMIELLESNESELKSICERLDCKVEFQDNKVSYSIPNVGLRSVKDALSHLLKQLAATARLCEPVSPIPVVIATLDISEHKMSSLSECAHECGFDVVGMSSSPLLSLLPYGISNQDDSFSGHVLIYDIGVRTLTLVLVRSDNGMLRTIKSQQYQDVGGVKLDETLLSVLKSVGEKLFRKDVTVSNKRALFKLLAAAEHAKHALSSQNTTNIYIESLSDGIDFQYTLSRGKFEGLCLPVFRSFVEPVESFIKSSGLTVNDVHKVVLVGGTCKTPKLQQMLQEVFSNSTEILSTIPPDHVAAMGAAMQGAYATELVIDGTIPNSIPCIPNDVTIECSNCVSDPSPLLSVPGHTPLPCRRSVNVSIKPKDSNEDILLLVQEACDNPGKSTIAQIKIPPSVLHSMDELFKLQIDFLWSSTDSKKSEVLLIIKDLEAEWRTEINLTKQ